MVDMSATIAAKSDQLNADDLIGGPRTITITRVTGNEGNAEQPVNVFFEGDDGKPFRPCKSMRRVMVAVWKADASKYVGQSMTLYRDPKVKWGGMEVGGIRISHMTGLDREMQIALMVTKGNRKPYVVKPLKVEAKEDAAAKWAAEFRATVDRAPDAEKLEQFVKSRSGKLDDLERQRPELHAECLHAIDNKRQSFKVADDWIEGPSDAERGEAHTEASLLEIIEAASTRDEWNAAEEAVCAATLDDTERAQLGIALEKRRGEIMQGAV